MSEQTSYRCDICGIEKQEANHWWKGFLVSGGTEELGKVTGIFITPWKQISLNFPSMESRYYILPKANAHLCGEAHAIEWASKNLSKR